MNDGQWIDNHLEETRRVRDPLENSETTPPSDSAIVVNGIGITELYSPHELPNLVKGLRHLGWATGEDNISIERNDPTLWIRAIRQAYSSGSWLNLGQIKPLAVKSAYTGPSRRAPLPRGVAGAFASLRALDPDLLAMTIWFEPNDHYSMALDRICRTDRQTELRPLRKGEPLTRGFETLRPEMLKREAVSNWRHDSLRVLYEWVGKFVPGFLSTYAVTGDPLAAIEYLSTPGPLTFQRSRSSPWRRVIGIDHVFNTYKVSEDPDIRIGQLFYDDRLSNYWLLTSDAEATPETIYNVALSSEGPTARIQLAITLRAALTCIIRDLMSSRELITSNEDPYTAEAAVSLLAQIHSSDRQYASQQSTLACARSMANDLSRLADQYPNALPPVEPIRGSSGLSRALSLSLSRETDYALERMTSKAQAITRQADLVGAIANLRLQDGIRDLTRMTVTVALVSLIIAFVALVMQLTNN